ncbi:MAG: hypothetical protein U0521_24560 [Anaerolineae bacterium]
MIISYRNLGAQFDAGASDTLMIFPVKDYGSRRRRAPSARPFGRGISPRQCRA